MTRFCANQPLNIYNVQHDQREPATVILDGCNVAYVFDAPFPQLKLLKRAHYLLNFALESIACNHVEIIFIKESILVNRFGLGLCVCKGDFANNGIISQENKSTLLLVEEASKLATHWVLLP